MFEYLKVRIQGGSSEAWRAIDFLGGLRSAYKVICFPFLYISLSFSFWENHSGIHLLMSIQCVRHINELQANQEMMISQSALTSHPSKYFSPLLLRWVVLSVAKEISCPSRRSHEYLYFPLTDSLLCTFT